jgi:hypothetical protein
LAPLADGFLRDLGRLVLVTVVVVALLSAMVAWAVNAYFGRTISGLVGGIGEYDFLLHVRADAKARAERQLRAYLPKALPGARLKPGLTIAGQAGFFLALPPELRTRTVMENIDSAFGSTPGYAGHTTLVEPGLVIRGVAPGAFGFFLDRLERLPGVAVAFADGQSLVVAVDRQARPEAVERRVKGLLGQYRLIEARFPMGYKVPDPRRAGERVVAAVDRRFGVAALDVTQSDRADDFRSFLASLTELRRFLLSYAADVAIALNPGVTLQQGDEVVGGDRVPPPGSKVGPATLRVMITGVEGRTAHGVPVQGDATPPGAAKAAGRVFQVLPGDRVGPPVGLATLRNPRQDLVASVDESLELLDQLQGVAKHAATTAARVRATLDSYQETLDRIAQAQTALAQVRQGLAGPLDGLGKVQTDGLVRFLNQAVVGIDDLLGKLDGVAEAQAALDVAAQAAGRREAAPGGAAAVAGVAQLAGETEEQRDLLGGIIGRVNPVSAVLLKWRAQAQNLALQVGNFGLLAENADHVTRLLSGLGQATEATLAAMRGIDVPAVQSDLQAISRRMEGIAQLDVDAVARQMRYVRDSLPDLKDEELGRSIRLIDRYIGGEVIPGERVQLLVPASLPAKEVADVVRAAAGERVTTAVLAPGSLQPDFRSLLFQVLGKARHTITALVAVALVAAALMLDHALIISVLHLSWRAGRRPRWWMAGAASGYGAGIGATLLLAVFVLSGARLPFFSWPGVAAAGGALGLVTAALAGRLAPVERGEVEAGQALGLSYARILREIVIPEGRPGLLFLLNRRALIFPQAASAQAGTEG